MSDITFEIQNHGDDESWPGRNRKTDESERRIGLLRQLSPTFPRPGPAEHLQQKSPQLALPQNSG